MAIRYEIEVLLHLKESPLCVKPNNLPPREEWMGPPPEPARPQIKTATDRFKPDGLLDQGNRRPAVDRHGSRNGGGADGIVLGPPRMNFSSSSIRTNSGDNDRNDKTPRDSDFRDRFMRGRIGEGDGNDRFRDGRNNNLRRRGDTDRDNEGWSTVKARKSFGQEGAERFTGRMGGDRREDRGAKERDDNDGAKDRPRRNLDADGDEGDAHRRNGLNRGRSEPWFKESNKPSEGPEQRVSNRERIEKAKSWRERDIDERPANSRNDRGNDRFDRRWDRDREQRVSERDPEWMDEPQEEKSAGHTEADLKKFMESMKASRGGTSKFAEKAVDAPELSPAHPAPFFSEAPAVKSAPAVERGPDKFFEAFGQSQLTASTPVGDKPEVGKAPAGKSSRFANLFSSQTGDSRGQTEPPTPAAGPPPPNGGSASAQQSDAEKEAFQALLQKLHLPRQNEQATPTQPPLAPPPQNVAQDPIQNLAQSLAQKAHITQHDPAEHYGMDRREEPRLRSVPPAGPEILAPRPVPPPSQPPSARPDQMLQDLLSQRHTTQSQSSGRVEHNASASRDFLMQLMQSGRHAPDPPRIEQIMRMPQPQRQASIPHFQEREPDFVREHVPAQRQMRPQGPAVFLEEQFRRSESDVRPMQPTQILQRPPPGLDHGIQPQQPWMQHGQQMPPTQRPMIPPPGLVGNPNRNVPIPGMFNPNMPPGVFPPDNMPGPPRNMQPNMQPPPGFFGGGPPPPGPGYIPPVMGGAFPGPDGMVFAGPFDGRGGMPPPGAAPFRR